MTNAVDMRGRNQRLAWILIGAFAALFLGSVFYIDWFHSIRAGDAVTRPK